ncbi:aldo/keto reductase [Neobacillus sp. MER 74]|uniref:aldo/keto reductase n=1 Tax=Neobacillus sp. MER 74 TaxID=2939566 RepID=UPI002040E9E0|nr:aldo/keto reductase [Neobacillus sp. MER 74]MCM3115367.1 aldo/keto reductase [Neobacillus sp. MER 74]
MKKIAIKGLKEGVSQIIMGSAMFTEDNMEQVCKIMDAYVAVGGNTVDLAYDYGAKVERAVGKWLKLRNNRDQMILIGKGAHHDDNGNRLNPECITDDLLASLDRVQTDYFDLYLLHRDDPTVPVAPIIYALNEHQQAGRIKAFGTSNWSFQRIQEANEYAAENRLSGFIVNSPNLSLAKPNEPRWAGCVSADRAYCEWHEQKQIPLFSWSSQSAGFFTGRYTPEIKDDEHMVRVYYSDANWERLRRAEELALKKGVSANHIALAYVLNQPFPTCAIIGPRSVEELHSSMEALPINISKNDVSWLDLIDLNEEYSGGLFQGEGTKC